MKPSDMNQEPVPLVRSRLKMLSMTLAGAPAPAPVAQVDHLADCLRAVLFLIRRDAPSLSGKALGLADAALQAYDTATAPVAQPVSQCSLKCTTECLARVHGCASECPALPWQPAAPAPVAPAPSELPPLPEACNSNRRYGNAGFHDRMGPVYSPDQMRAYARAAIEAATKEGGAA